MKSAIIALALTLSSQVMAKTPATAALSNLLKAGQYVGVNGNEECSVKVIINENSAGITVTNGKNSANYSLVNSSSKYSVDEVTNEISASQSLRAPFYLNGGTLLLNVKETQNDEVKVSIATIALDHKGNDYSSYNTCTVTK